MDIKVIKQLRLTRGYTQQEIATKLNIDRSTYSTWENGKVDLTLSQVGKIALVYNINPVVLVKMFFEGIDISTNVLDNQLHKKNEEDLIATMQRSNHI